MKLKVLLLSLSFGLLSAGVTAQKQMRIGYVDMEYILENLPEYQQASNQLEARVQEWRKEAELKRKEISEMKNQLANERALLTKELIEEREEEIAYLEGQANDYEQKRFGPNGDYFIQKRQLIRPVQDQVFNAVQEIAENRGMDFIFDRNSESGMLFASRQADVSEQVLRNITRAANREQIENRQQERELEAAEARTPEQDAAREERAQVAEERKNEREALIEERRRQRDSIRDARQKEFEERRQRALEERQRKRDSITAARTQKDTIN
jgi:Skp family chaperone for outer membrane proteins